MTTRGDREWDVPLTEFEGLGVFCDMLDRALLDGDVDLVVHSCKDLPYELPEDLVLEAVLARGDPQEVAVLRPGLSVTSLRQPGLRVGTCSHRRSAQWQARFPAHEIRPIRGNVDDRLEQVRRGNFDVIVLAVAGLERLGLLSPEHVLLRWMLPAPAQGAIGIVTRRADQELRAWLHRLNHQPTWLAVQAERIFAATLDETGQASLGALARFGSGEGGLRWGSYRFDGRQSTSGVTRVSTDDPSALAQQALEEANHAGIYEVLGSARRRVHDVGEAASE